jgi:hypothetical protein
VATLTYSYLDSTAVVGPLSPQSDPHGYDLCAAHAERTTAPRGWEVLHLELGEGRAEPSHDDLVALADAVREAARPPAPLLAAGEGHSGPDLGRRGHLRALPTIG